MDLETVGPDTKNDYLPIDWKGLYLSLVITALSI